MRRVALALIGLAPGCGGLEDSLPAADASPVIFDCTDDVPPTKLECTGLYSNLETKEIASGVRAYTPAIPLWSDGADKERWILLPKGTTIDAQDPNEWKFPVGTKVWKEFSVGGKRVETRLFQKVLQNHWVHAAYAWDEAESAAPISPGGDVTGPTGPYHIPTRDECDDCHRGRTDRVLGFEEVSLGLDGATGLTLEKVVSEGLIEPAPSRTSLSIGDDGTGLAAAPLGWLHVNCGVACHNGNSNARAYGAKMRLRLDPTLLDGRPSSDFESLGTTVNVEVNTPTWHAQTRIVPGDPDRSLLVTLISNRGRDNPAANQMPPIASREVDRENTQKVVEWIRRMAAPPGGDSSVPEAGSREPGVDAGPQDAGPDVSIGDAGQEGESGGIVTSADGGIDAGVDADADASSTSDADVSSGREASASDSGGG